MSPDSVVHLLAIDWPHLPNSVTETLPHRQADIAPLLASASVGGELEIVIVASRRRFQVYTVGAGRTAGIRAVLRAVLVRMGGFTRLGHARVIEASGLAAARELFRSATGLDGEFALGLRGLYAITTAAALAVEAGSIGEHLTGLFAHANSAAWTAHRDTELGSALLSSERRELARFAAERIVEEQLLVWQSTYAEPMSRVVAHNDFPAEYSADEISSIVRVRMPASARESVA